MTDPTKEANVETLEDKRVDAGSHDSKTVPTTNELENGAHLTAGPNWFYTPRWYLGGSYYASPWTQLVLISFVCFMCPGMFNAVNGIGAGGQVDAVVSDRQNTALNSVFSVVGFFAGSIVNRIGVRLTLGMSGIGYVLYIASFLCYNHTKNEGFVIFAGAFLGLCAGLLWSAQGAIMMSYPLEKDKGKFISWFWMIFNLGAVIGSLVSPKCVSCRNQANSGRFLLVRASTAPQVPLAMAYTALSLPSCLSVACCPSASVTQRPSSGQTVRASFS